MAELEAVLARLDQGGWERLATLWVEHLLDRPVSELLDPALVADLAVTTLEATASNDRTEAWLRERINEARARVPTGNLRDRVPSEIVAPLERLLERPYVPERLLVRRLLRHEAVETLLRDTLVGALGSFARRMRPPGLGQAGRGLGRLRESFGEGLKEGLLGGLSHELERQAEARVRDFVDSTLQAIMDEVAIHLCDPANALQFGAWRAYLLETLLDTDLRTLAREAEKFDPEAAFEASHAIVKALLQQKDLKEQIRTGLERVATEAGDRSLRGMLAEAGLDPELWRPGVEAMLAREGRSLGSSAAFRVWLGEVLG